MDRQTISNLQMDISASAEFIKHRRSRVKSAIDYSLKETISFEENYLGL